MNYTDDTNIYNENMLHTKIYYMLLGSTSAFIMATFIEYMFIIFQNNLYVKKVITFTRKKECTIVMLLYIASSIFITSIFCLFVDSKKMTIVLINIVLLFFETTFVCLQLGCFAYLYVKQLTIFFAITQILLRATIQIILIIYPIKTLTFVTVVLNVLYTSCCFVIYNYICHKLNELFNKKNNEVIVNSMMDILLSLGVRHKNDHVFLNSLFLRMNMKLQLVDNVIYVFSNNIDNFE